jgi:hypothetical protein
VTTCSGGGSASSKGRRTPAKFVDFTLAPDAATAEEQVAEAHEIPETVRGRLVAIRED